jgi:hypothetical protein
MKELNLDSGVLRVKVDGKELSFRCDTEFAENAANLAEEAERRAMLAKAHNKNTPYETSAFLSYAIDTLVGDGTVETLFGEDLPDAVALCEVLSLIIDAFDEYRRARLSRLTEGVTA